MSKHSMKQEVRRAKSEDKKNRKKLVGDSFQNFAAGIGIGTDNISSAGIYGFNPVTRIRQQLEWVYRGSWLGGVAVDAIAEDMTRAGVSLEGELKPEQIQKINESATSLKIWEALADVIRWGRLYGGAIGVMLIDGQQMQTPLRMESVGPEQFRGIYVMDRWQLNPSLNDIVKELGPTFGKPKFYQVVASQLPLTGQKIHYTRCIRHDGIQLPIWQAMTENMWGISVLERLWDRMLAFDSATQGAAQLVYKAYIRTYKIADFRDNISAGGPALEGLLKFVDMMRRLQTNEGITLLDKEDEFEAHANSSFSGLSDALVQFAQQLAGALGIPLVRLFGQSPAGLNSTGESDIRMYYDNINQRQKSDLQVPVTVVYRLLAQSLGFKVPKGFGVEFNPLWQLTDEQKATIASSVTTTVKEAHETGLVSQQTALRELKQSADITGVWSNISEEDIEAAEEELPPSPSDLEQQALEQGGDDDDSPAPARGGAPRPKTKDSDTPEFQIGTKVRPSNRVQMNLGVPIDTQTWHVTQANKQRILVEPGNKNFGVRPKYGIAYRYEITSSNGIRGWADPEQLTKDGQQDQSLRSIFSIAYHHGLYAVIENPKGSHRSGGTNGNAWDVVMPADYGYIRRFTGADGDAIDCYIGDKPESDKVYVIDQRNLKTGSFDEHKIMLGYDNPDEAAGVYTSGYHDGKGQDRLMNMTEVSMDVFKAWLQNGNLNEPYAGVGGTN